jgi:hypothetical protein
MSGFDAIAAHWKAFWRREPLEKPILQIVLPKEGKTPVSKPYPVIHNGNPDAVADQVLAWLDTHEFFGDAFPFFMMEFGPEHFATFLGAETRYGSGTGWIVPFVEDWKKVRLSFRKDTDYWRGTVNHIRTLRHRCDGKVIINSPVLSGGLDALSAIRGPERLLMDLVERPEEIEKALADVRTAYHEVVEALAKELGWDEFGSATWLGSYVEGRTMVLQSDVSCMLSNAMFRRFEVANLEHQAGQYKAVIYHLDGPGAIQHLETVCAVKGIEGVQYVPVPNDSEEEIESLCRRIDSLGMGIHRNATPRRVLASWGSYKARRVAYNVQDIRTRKEAEALLSSF